MQFANEIRPKLKEENSVMTVAEIAKEAGARYVYLKALYTPCCTVLCDVQCSNMLVSVYVVCSWKSMSASEKSKYEQKAQKLLVCDSHCLWYTVIVGLP